MTDQINYDNFSDVKIIDNGALPELTESLDEALVRYAGQIIDKSRKSRDDHKGIKLNEIIKKIEKADRLEHQDVVINKPAYRSKVYLSWIKQAHISTTAFLAAMLMTGNWNTLTGNTPEDKENALKMSKVINYLFQNNHEFRNILIQVLYQFVQKGMTCCKGFWQYISSYFYNYKEEVDKMGQTVFVRNKEESVAYNDVKLEYVDIDDYHFYPINKTIADVTEIYITKVKYSDLMANQQKRWIPEQLAKIRDNKTNNELEEEDVNLLECWIKDVHLNINCEKLRISNVIVTIADDHVIEFKENFHDNSITPFAWAVFEPIPGTNLGRGLCFDAYDIEQSAIMLFNALLDDIKTKVYSMWYISSELGISSIQNKPGGAIIVKPEHFEKNALPRPVEFPSNNNALTFDVLYQLKREFEAATVPEFIKGIRPERDETATRDVLVQQGTENKLTVAADNFNEMILKSVLRLFYVLYRKRSQIDPAIKLRIAKITEDHTEEVQIPVLDKLTGQPTGEVESQIILKDDEQILVEFQEILPLERVDISIDGYKTNVKKREFIKNAQVAYDVIARYGDDYIKKKIDSESALKELLLAMDIDADKILLSDEAAVKADLKKIQFLMQLPSFAMLQGGQDVETQ